MPVDTQEETGDLVHLTVRDRMNRGRSVIRCLIVSVFVGLLAPALAAASNFTEGNEVAPFPDELKPGDYIWHPEISPAGPVVVVISVPDQQMYVFRNGVRIGRSTVSTGKKGHRPRRASSPSSNARSTTSRASTKARRCRTCSA